MTNSQEQRSCFELEGQDTESDLDKLDALPRHKLTRRVGGGRGGGAGRISNWDFLSDGAPYNRVIGNESRLIKMPTVSRTVDETESLWRSGNKPIATLMWDSNSEIR